LPASIDWPDSARKARFDLWLARIQTAHGLQPQTLTSASADASFRRYLRLQSASGSLVIMDAPPPLEDVRPFVRVAQLLHSSGLAVPQVLEADIDNGFLLLTDLGTQLYLAALQQAQANNDQAQTQRLMVSALQALVQMQQGVPTSALPRFDEALLRSELELFPTWCVQQEFGQTWTAHEQAVWQQCSQWLVDSALQQPQVAVHADWMPRNLMLPLPGAPNQPGVLDFQDAVAGPITYDTASLLRDAFISHSEEQELDWAVRVWQMQRTAGLPVDADFGEHWRQLEWMGLQRHLKVLGIFCRLKHRDGKAQYAQDLPRFLGYATKVCLRYGPLKPLLKLLEPLSGARVTQGFTF
jgi:N-acetylmuramate 1-kinase